MIIVNKIRHRITILLFIWITFFIAPSSLAKPDSNSYQDFSLSLKKAANTINDEVAATYKTRLKKGYIGQKEVGVSGSKGAWSAELVGYIKVSKKINADGILSQKSPLTIINHDDRMEYTFLLPEVDMLFLNSVENKLEKQKNSIAERNKDVSVSFSKENTRIKVTATYDYPDDASSIKTQKRLENLFSDSRSLLMAFMQHSLTADKELRKELNKKKLSTISKEELIFLIDEPGLDLSLKEVITTKTQEGYFKFDLKKNTFHIWNYGDNIEIGISSHSPNSEDNDVRDKMTKWLEDKPAKKADLMKILDLSPSLEDRNNEVAIVALYQLNGAISGKELRQYITTFINSYGPSAKKQYTKFNNH